MLDVRRSSLKTSGPEYRKVFRERQILLLKLFLRDLFADENLWVVSERKLGFFVKIKEDQNFNRRNTFGILRIKIFI
jgi:hypothetical protein